VTAVSRTRPRVLPFAAGTRAEGDVVKKALKWIAIVFGVLVVLCCGTALLLPNEWKIQTSVVIDAPPERIYPYLAKPRVWVKVIERHSRTMKGYEDTTFRYTFGDVDEGAGAWWVSDSESGAMTSHVRIDYTKGDPKTGLAYEGRIEQDEVNAHGTISFEPVDGGTRVTWTDTGTMARAKGGGLMVFAIEAMMTPAFQGFLQSLKEVVEGDLPIEPAK